ncbi:MAG TPA: YeeE/YedE family protein [Geminicoccaceae bacterium]|nr:YeeE/YedE family protein [Geminicoccus sp.]HMU49918.1 YeeE/YedE family protein [Geminicoccaceae bacterium]
MSLLVDFLLGLLFGVGLVVSGMADPARVLGFLDPLGNWDPSLAFVMAGAVSVAFVGYRLAFRRGRPVLASSFQLPARTAIDPRLVVGAGIFGIGWGLGGLCPGPALASLGLGSPGVLVFVPAMLLGMWAARLISAPAAREVGTSAA